jgi:hypothetical protein
MYTDVSAIDIAKSNVMAFFGTFVLRLMLRFMLPPCTD